MSTWSDEQRALFWRRFEQVAGTYPNVLRHVLTSALCSKSALNLLRGSSRAMRKAVNRSVTTVLCTMRLKYFEEADLDPTVFPHADGLRLTVEDGLIVGGMLEDVVASIPLFLRNIQRLQVHLPIFAVPIFDLPIFPDAAVVAPSLAKLLSRCGSAGLCALYARMLLCFLRYPGISSPE
jgi:hypothetical protein